MIRRIEVYPNMRVAKHAMEAMALEKDVNYYNKATLELTTEGIHYIFVTKTLQFRGWMYDQIYIHPNCKNRLEYIVEARTRGAKIVYKS